MMMWLKGRRGYIQITPVAIRCGDRQYVDFAFPALFLKLVEGISTNRKGIPNNRKELDNPWFYFWLPLDN